MLRILIADGTPAAMQAERETFGIPSNASLFEAALRSQQPHIRCSSIHVADGEDLPGGVSRVRSSTHWPWNRVIGVNPRSAITKGPNHSWRSQAPESPAVTEQLMEEVCDRRLRLRAWPRS
jgi:hypothetical protein